MTQRIFAPSGMEHSTYGGHDRVIPGLVSGYSRNDANEPWRRARALSYTRGYGLGGMITTVEDSVAGTMPSPPAAS